MRQDRLVGRGGRGGRRRVTARPERASDTRTVHVGARLAEDRLTERDEIMKHMKNDLLSILLSTFTANCLVKDFRFLSV